MKSGHVATFNTARYEKTAAEMRTRGEEVHAKGREIYRRTHKLDPLVDVNGKIRLSHNSMAKDNGHCILVHGPALPILSAFDGTASMGDNVAIAHKAAGEVNAMLDGIRGIYHPQISCAVWQDVLDEHPVVQQTQFEGDEKYTEQVRMLVPTKDGGDVIEDYQLGLAYLMLAVNSDISNFYGLKGYLMIVGDQIGRERVTVEDVRHHLGHCLQKDMTTKVVAHQVSSAWHSFYVHVGSGGGGKHDFASDWWLDKLGTGHVIIVPDPNLLAEVQCSLIYATETPQPTADGLKEFLSAGGANKKVTMRDVDNIWGWITEANVLFGAQTMLPGYVDLPKPGSVFEHFRHQWPIGHPRFAENVIPAEAEAVDPSAGRAPKHERPNWERF